MDDLVEERYRRVSGPDSRRLERGQIGWAPVQYLSSRFQSVGLASYNPRDESLSRYTISTHEPDDQSPFRHAPVHELKLRHDEALLVNRAKYRPVVVISQRGEDWPPAGNRLAERGRVCLPFYSFQARDTSEFRQRIRAQEYPWWIYLPEHSTFKEGFARIDKIQTIEEAQIRPSKWAFTDDALWFVSEWLRYFLTDEIDPMLLEYREESLKALTQSP